MYLLPGLAVGQAAGVLLADFDWLGRSAALWLGAGCFGAALALRGSPARAALCSIGVFVAIGALGLHTRFEQADRHAPVGRIDVALEGRVCRTQAGFRWIAVELCEVRTTQFGVARRRGSAGSASRVPAPQRIRFVESRETDSGKRLAALASGEVVRLRARLRAPGGLSNPGGPDRAQVSRRHGVGASARLLDPALLVRIPERDTRTLARGVWGLRQRIGKRLSASGPGGALLRALATGERSQLSNADREAFARLGIAHLLAVSGLHLGLAGACAFWAFRSLLARIGRLAERRDSRPLAFAGACGVAVGYALLAGWGVPVRRALVFLLLAGVGLFAARRRSGPHALALAGIVVLAREPAALFELGAQLSFVATAALLSALPRNPQARLDEASRWRPQRGWPAARAVRLLESSLRVSATAVAATAPVLAWHGLQVGSAGLLANLVAVPWTAVGLLPLSLAAAGIAASPAGEAIAEPLLAAAEWMARGSLAVVRWVSAVVPVGTPCRVPGWAVGVAGVGVLAALRMPGTGQRLIAALLVTAWLQAIPSAELAPPPPRLVAFDVGIGDAVLVQGRDGAALIDGGWASPDGADLGRTVLLPALRALSVRSLVLVVATHADLDHRGGLESVLAELPVRELWLPFGADREPAFGRIRSIARARGIPILERGAGGAPLESGDLRITPLWPPEPGAGPRSRSRNDSSLVVRVELGDKRVLLTGDIGEAAELALLASGADLRADVLKLAHHGSRGSSTSEFLEAVDAQVAVVSAACARHGLPTAEALTRARRRGMAVWSTGRDGAVVVSLGRPGDAIAIWGWAAHPRCDLP